nr:hypothetical protein [Tanacetum cinerariifolium]
MQKYLLKQDNGRRPAYKDDLKALVTIDGEDIDWSGHVEEDAQNYAMMAYSFSNLGSDNKDFGLQSISHVNAATTMILMLLLGFNNVRSKDLMLPL